MRHAATALADGKVLIVGGTVTDAVASAGAELFDPETSTSSVIPGAMTIGRRDASATSLVDQRVLVVGGNDGNEDLASRKYLNPGPECLLRSIPRAI